MGQPKVIIAYPGFRCNIHLVSSDGINACIKFVFLRHRPYKRCMVSPVCLRNNLRGSKKGMEACMHFTIPSGILCTESKPVLQQPTSILYGFICPDSTGMITKGTLLSSIGCTVCFRKSTITMTPFVRGNDREHLTGL